MWCLLALDFPVVVALAWIFDVKGGGGRHSARRDVAFGAAAIGGSRARPVAWYSCCTSRGGGDRINCGAPFASLSGERDAAYFAWVSR